MHVDTHTCRTLKDLHVVALRPVGAVAATVTVIAAAIAAAAATITQA